MGDSVVEQSTQKKSGLKRTESAKERREWEKLGGDQSFNQSQPSRLKRSSSGRGLLGATGTVPRAATLGPRRANTPSKTEAPPLPKQNFTAAQKLAILERLENRNFIRGGGLEQFREEFNQDGKSEGNACKQNLATAFASLDKPAAVAGGGKEMKPEAAHWTTTIEDGYSELPPYIKIVDKFLVMQYTTERDLMRLADLKTNTSLSKVLAPLKLAPLLSKMTKLLNVLEKMMKQPGVDFDILELFKPEFMVDQKGNTYVLHCDIRERPKVLQAFKKVPQLLDRLTRLHNRLQEQKQKPMDCNAKLKDMKQKLDKLEKMLRELNMNTKEQTDLFKKAKELKNDGDSSSDSLEDFFDGLSDASSLPSPPTS